MADPKHTPGPWKFDDDWGRTPMVVAADGKTWVAAVQKKGGTGSRRSTRTPEQEANARLIAAAPDLLAALKSLHANCTAADEFMRAAEFVIAKAEGRG